MDTSLTPQKNLNRATRRTVGLVATVVLVLLAWYGWQIYRRGPDLPPVADPRLTLETPYRNVRPDVAYVGSASCTACHPDVASSYAHHPMAQTLFPVAAAPPIERYDTGAHNPFEAHGFEFRVQAADGRMSHAEVKRGAGGRELAVLRANIAYSLGSGVRGRSYLVDRDGFLFQSPISWYSQPGIWDLSPGYARQLSHFERAIQPECLFCHSGHADHVDGTVNRYHQPVFTETTIGCERCHGPGALHVQVREAGTPAAKIDDTIVNPRHLAPALRDAVCEQCHLPAVVRVLHVGRKWFEYRPGLPLEAFLSAFVKPPELADESKAVSHVEQMHVSRCFQESNGGLGCISCHDPHALPQPAQKAAYYRDRCLTCHHDRGCRLPEAERRVRDNSCIACHMPRFDSSVAHTAATDHRIPRRPSPASAGLPLRPPVDTPLVNFYRDRLSPNDPDAARDFGVALTMTGGPQARGWVTAKALPLLDAALARRPDDAVARDARGTALWLAGNKEQALAEFEACLARDPTWETALLDAAGVATQLGRHEQAAGYWRRVLAMNPWTAGAHLQLAHTLSARGDWAAAAAACRDALRLSPASVDARKRLAECLVRQGDAAAARRELATLQELEPARAVELERWFDGVGRTR